MQDIISSGVPQSLNKIVNSGLDYGGIIIYTANLKKPCTISGAVYYNYFKKNIHNCAENKHHAFSLIRGFSIVKNKSFNFYSDAFNYQNCKFYDRKYKDLPFCEKKFIQYAI